MNKVLPLNLRSHLPNVPIMFFIAKESNSESWVAFGYCLPFVSLHLEHFQFFLDSHGFYTFEVTCHYFYRMSLNLRCLVFLHWFSWFRVYIFSRNITEVLRASSHCLLSGGTNADLCYHWRSSLPALHSHSVCPASPQSYSFFFGNYQIFCVDVKLCKY